MKVKESCYPEEIDIQVAEVLEETKNENIKNQTGNINVLVITSWSGIDRLSDEIINRDENDEKQQEFPTESQVKQ